MNIKPLKYNLNKKLNIPALYIFNVIKDVSNYKNILQFCSNSIILEKFDDLNFNAELTINYGLFEEKYISLVNCKKDFNYYEVLSTNKNKTMFSNLSSKWKIYDYKEYTEINYDIEYKLNNYLYQAISKSLLKNISNNTFKSFINKAKNFNLNNDVKIEENLDLNILKLILNNEKNYDIIINKMKNNNKLIFNIKNLMDIYDNNYGLILKNKDKIKYYIELIILNN